jgi:phosphomevalonate kinase
VSVTRRLPLLALSGKRFSGKDTLAALLVKAAADRCITLETHAFAAECKRLFVQREAARGVEIDLARLQSDREYKEQRRPELTKFTVLSLADDPLVFCRSVADRIESSTHPALVTDVRLRLEVEHLRPRFDLHLVRITRSDASRAESGWKYVASVDEHHTETELDDPSLWDETLANDGTIDELRVRAEELVGRLARVPS